MTVVLLGLVSALLYGVSDFFGALASRTQPAARVSLLALLVGAAAVPVALLLSPAEWSASAVLFGALAGVAAGLGLMLYYAALAAGPIGFASPVVALLCAVLPTVFAVATGERLAGLAVAAIGAVVVGGVLIGIERDQGLRPHRRTVLLTLGTGFVWAPYYVFIDLTPDDSGAVPMVSETLAAVAAVGIVLFVQRRRSAAARRALTGREVAWVIVAGLTQGVATVLLIAALHLPGLAVVSALSALYPVATVLLAVTVLHEKVRAHQAAGLLVAIGGVAVLALARA